VTSVLKKLRDRAFARTVNRADVYRGAEELGRPLEEHLGFLIQALTAAAPRLGLGGPGP
jgi:predicted hydrolase (HD superfamily)